MEWDALVGVDWGNEEHAYTVVDHDGKVTSSGTTKTGPAEVQSWILAVRQRHPNGTIVVAVEDGCRGLLYSLVQYEFVVVVPINPRASKAYRDSQRLSGASSDPSDAQLICDFAFKHLSTLRRWQPDDAITRELRMLTEHRRELVDQRTAATHALSSALKMFFPQALQWFGRETSKPLLAFLKRWPTLLDAQGATEEDIAALLRLCRCRKIAARARALRADIASAVAPISDLATIRGSSRYAQAQIAIIETLNIQIAIYEAATDQAWASHPDRAVFDSLPGAGAVLAPRMAAVMGTDRARYLDAVELQCYSGIAPVVEQSGRRRWVHARWGYPTFLHQTFHEFAQTSISQSAWAKAVYQQRRDAGEDHHTAIRALAFRWIRIIFRLWTNGETYDEQVHIERLREKGSPILATMAA